MVFGYALTMPAVMRAGVGLRQALGVALAADTVSITCGVPKVGLRR